MAPVPAVLALLNDQDLAESVDRTAAAAGLRVARAHSLSPRNWSTPVAVILDRDAAEQCVSAGLPRRDGVVLVGPAELGADLWSMAVDIGAQFVCALPAQETELVGQLTRWSESAGQDRRAARGGRVIAVTGGRGGAGSSVFAAAVAQCADDALLVDFDGCGGGIDLLLGAESAPGLRWPDLVLRTGRLNWAALREALPRRGGVSVMSASRVYCDIDAGAASAVVDAGRRGGTAVVCDVPRQLTQAAVAILESADLVVIVTSCDVRSIASTTASVGVVRTINPNVGLVVRGPSPGGLRATELGEVVAAPLLAAMRPEPMLAQQLERGGLKLRRRSPLAAAARTVLGVLDRRATVMAA